MPPHLTKDVNGAPASVPAHAWKVALILLLATALRLPGVAWDFNPSTGQFRGSHSDETALMNLAADLARDTPRSQFPYVRAYPFTVAIAHSCALSVGRLFGAGEEEFLFQWRVIGRLVSVLAGVLTVALLFFLARYVFNDSRAGYFSAMFLATAGLHVTNSRFATADSATTLVFWSAIAAAILFRLRGRWFFFWAASALIGLGLATKLSFPLLFLFPFLVSDARRRARTAAAAVAAVGAALVALITFDLANRAGMDPKILKAILKNIRTDNIDVTDHARSLNPFFFILFLIPGVGLPGFVAAAATAARLRWSRLSVRERALAGIAGPVVALHLAMISTLSIPFLRHALPLVPAICLAAGAGLSRFSRRWKRPHAVTLAATGLFAYQLLGVLSLERAYFSQPAADAKAWIKEHWQAGDRVFTRRVAHPFDYERLAPSLESAQFAYIDASFPFTFDRSQINPVRAPACSERLYHATGAECEAYWRLRDGKSNFTDVRRFTGRGPLTPEHWLYDRIWGPYAPATGNVVVYAKPRRASPEAPR
jgi:hypothetical protein